MCSRYSFTSPIEAVRTMFRLPAEGLAAMQLPPRYNIAPTQPVAIVRLKPGLEALGERELALVRWGLIPSWVKDPNDFSTLINARAETAIEKPSFKNAMKHRRCLVPADAFYEWTGKPGSKVPHLIQPRQGGGLDHPMAFAGLWEHWLGPEGSEMESMVILTVPANGDVAAIHDRMPAILPPRHYAAWLDVRGTDATGAAKLLKPPADDVLEAFEVSRAINNPTYDKPDVQVKVS